MSLIDEGKIIIRAGINELQPKALNPHVPYGAEEVAADAVECARAGACIVHFHSRTEDGAQALVDDRNGASIYRRAIELTARESDVIMEPTNFPLGNDPSLAVDVPHLWSLVEQPPPGARLEVVNLDGFRFAHNRTGWDQVAQRLVALPRSRDDETPFRAPEVIRETIERGLVPFFGVFDLADIRILRALASEGHVPLPVLIQINLFGDLLRGPTPSVEALDAFLVEWRREPVDAEICFFAREVSDVKSYDRLLEGAIARGVHLRVGLGDNARLFPDATNAEMVERAVEIAGRMGLNPVSSAELRDRVGLAKATWPDFSV